MWFWSSLPGWSFQFGGESGGVLFVCVISCISIYCWSRLSYVLFGF